MSGMDREDERKRIIVDVSKLSSRHQNRGRQLSPGRARRKFADWVGGVWHRGGVISIQALRRNCGNSSLESGHSFAFIVIREAICIVEKSHVEQLISGINHNLENARSEDAKHKEDLFN